MAIVYDPLEFRHGSCLKIRLVNYGILIAYYHYPSRYLDLVEEHTHPSRHHYPPRYHDHDEGHFAYEFEIKLSGRFNQVT